MLFGMFAKVSGQSLEIPDLKGKIVYGGNFGGGMTGNVLNLSIAPQVGYRVLGPWEVGIRGIYDMTCYFDKVNGNVYDHYFGLAPYTNYEVFSGLFLHVEDEVMYGFSRWKHETEASQWFNSVFVGGGYRQYTYSGSFAYFMVLYNLSWGNLSANGLDTPYASPFSVRVGYCF